MSGPASIAIDGGPLGQLAISGGVNGYGFINTPENAGQESGVNIGETAIALQKTGGTLQFTVTVASLGGENTLATPFYPPSVDIFTTGPLYEGYLTLAPPDSGFTLSAGQLDGLEGYESGFSWYDPSQFATALYYVEAGNGRGVNATYAHGAFNAALTFGDGYDTGVFNFLQGLISYSFDASNSLSLFYGGNLGTVGRNANLYGGTVGDYAAGPNSQMLGGWYVWTQGSWTLTPELQGQYAKANFDAGLLKPSWNFGAALFYSYQFGSSPYSIGGWGEYFTSHSAAEDNFNWFVGPNARATGIAVSPTWQSTHLYARANLGEFFLLHNIDALGKAYGYGSGTGRNMFQVTLEAGLLF
jgi:hypothetical protein